MSVEVRETAGSVENLQLLGQPDQGVSVAIVQSGVATPEELPRYYTLGSLYHEPLWVFYRGRSGSGSVSLQANESESGRKGAARLRSPCGCLRPMA